MEPVDAGEHAAWTKAAVGDTAAVEAFLKTHPRGRYAAAAQARLAALREPPAVPVGSPVTPVVGTFPAVPPRRVGEVFRDCGDCPELVVIPAGEFTMGSPSSEAGREDDEGPQDRVRIGSPLAVGRYEVMVGEYGRFVRDSGHDGGSACLTYEGHWKERPGRSWESPGFEQGERHPVACVSWVDAQAYVRWLSQTTGHRYRLLSESEWEYAARAGTTTAFHTGERITAAEANFNGNSTYNGSSKGEYRQRTVPVGSFGANRFGLHDVHGNVWEWVEDCWNWSYSGAPSDGTVWQSGDCGRRVQRGGSWVNFPSLLRSANRNWLGTGFRGSNCGFRVARTL